MGTLYNQAIAPLVGYALRSFVWDQGEANMNEGYHLSRRNYHCTFATMIIAWREAWNAAQTRAPAGEAETATAASLEAARLVRSGWAEAPQRPSLAPATPWTFVQLHSCDVGNDEQMNNYGAIRMAQDDAVRFGVNVAMAVAFDYGHVGIHSPHKAEVGVRLALKVAHNAFGVVPAPASAQAAAASTSTFAADDGPIIAGACVHTAPSYDAASQRNITRVALLLSNAKGLHLSPTAECAAQSPLCCNVTANTSFGRAGYGVASGVAQISVGNVWIGEDWHDAIISIGPDGASLLLTADLGDMLDPVLRAPVWEVQGWLGAFPSCSLRNMAEIPLAPFGPLAVSPTCVWPTAASGAV